jgi:hypothetical protein
MTETTQSIITITDEHTTYSVSTVVQNNNQDSIVRTLTNDWFNKFGFPQTIHFKEGKVRVSQLAQKINNMAPPMTLTCKNWPTTFNTETKQKWKLTQ